MKDRIKAIRKALDLTQQEFADKMGMQRATLSKYEAGKNLPSATALSLICRTFGVREEWLRTGEGDMFTASDYDRELSEFFAELTADGSDAFRTRFVALLRRIPDDYWVLIENYMKQLVSDAGIKKD